MKYLAKRRVRTGADSKTRLVLKRLEIAAAGLNAIFDFLDDPFGLLRPTMDDEPARALWQPHPHENDDQANRCADQEGKPPTEFRIDQRRIQQRYRSYGPKRRSDPKTAVDRQIGRAAITRRH